MTTTAPVAPSATAPTLPSTKSDPTTSHPAPHPRATSHTPPRPRRRRRPSDSSLRRTPTSTVSSFISPSADANPDDLWTRAIRNPLGFLSFVLSLSYVDWSVTHRNRGQGWGWGAGWLPWGAEGEAWQSEVDSTWGRDGVGAAGGVQRGRKGSWPIRKKLRKMARLEIGDALEMRGWVAGCLVAGMVGAVVLGWVLGRWAWRGWAG
ncbi:Cullin-4 [Sphaceloma murrayae]|uniref:Cullin-4 n=1 Tax=Sphaceloma murrayae TaxID=2082308 RepID=A0A2K1QS05_9PEZI|nr:Cullin-4 [Sphaceloma murrayae]